MYILLKHTKKCKLNGTKINKHSQIKKEEEKREKKRIT
jgi:hypothetical protein